MIELPAHNIKHNTKSEIDMTLAEVERRHIIRVWDDCRHHVRKTCERLGISKSTLYRRLQECAPEQWEIIKRKVCVRR